MKKIHVKAISIGYYEGIKNSDSPPFWMAGPCPPWAEEITTDLTDLRQQARDLGYTSWATAGKTKLDENIAKLSKVPEAPSE